MHVSWVWGVLRVERGNIQMIWKLVPGLLGNKKMCVCIITSFISFKNKKRIVYCLPLLWGDYKELGDTAPTYSLINVISPRLVSI